MDRSFLSDKDVITASRKFVCIRLATYENAQENQILKRMFAPGGVLQNTVFAILASNGRTHLVRSGRSPVWAFGGMRGPGIHEQPVAAIKNMAQTMQAIARKYPGKAQAAQESVPLPYLSDVRLALNVAAADRQPLVAVYSPDADQRRRMEQTLSPIAWSGQFIGTAQYVAAQNRTDLKAISGNTHQTGYVVIQPGTFGLTGEVIGVIPADTPSAQLQSQLATALARHKPSRLSYNQHRQAGVQAGARWQSKTPVTDGAGGRRGRRRPR